jgi:aminoglycoside phosphotransferase family enzyme
MSNHARLPPAPAIAARDCRLADKVAWLKRSLGPGDELVETHFSYVLLAGDRAWKLRKPVRRDPMDYSTLEARRRDSEAEVRLNRRLAPHAYLGMRPLTLEADGQLALGGTGVVVDWLVEMRRLDRSRMLDVVLAAGGTTDADLHSVAALLASFYAREPAALSDGATLQARLLDQVAANHRVIATRDGEAAGNLRRMQASFLEAQPVLLDARAAAGCIVEAHGDLRPEHILLSKPPAVIDCLEFDRNLRILDRAEELEFLALECGRIGHAAAGAQIAGQCLAMLGDAVPMRLQQFYRSHRAATRAKLYSWRASEPDDGDTDHWLATAGEYLAIALEAAARAGT